MRKTVICDDVHGNHEEIAVAKLRWRPSAYAIVIKDGKLLVAPQFGRYDLPGGGIELGETLEEGLLREVKEETGITVVNPRLLTVGNGFFMLPESTKGRYIESLLFYYVCDFVSGELSDKGFDEHERKNSSMPEWLPLEKLSSIKAGGSLDWRKLVQELTRV